MLKIHSILRLPYKYSTVFSKIYDYYNSKLIYCIVKDITASAEGNNNFNWIRVCGYSELSVRWRAFGRLGEGLEWHEAKRTLETYGPFGESRAPDGLVGLADRRRVLRTGQIPQFPLQQPLIIRFLERLQITLIL